MKLVQLVVENFRGAPNGAYSFTHSGTREPLPLVLITGGPSSGKTALLEAIAVIKEIIGGYGPAPNPARLLRHGLSSGRVTATWQFSTAEMERAQLSEPTWTADVPLGERIVLPLFDGGVSALFAAYSHEPNAGKFEYFPANRRLVFSDGAAPSDAAAEARLRLSKTAEKYAAVRQTLINLALGQGLRAVEHLHARGILLSSESVDLLAPYKQSLAKLLPNLRLWGVEMRGSDPAVLFEHRNGTVVRLEDLSESEQQAVLFGVTFQRIGLSRSIVLIDEPELHIHSTEQRRFLDTISGLGIDNQIIVATGSEPIVKASASQQVIRLG